METSIRVAAPLVDRLPEGHFQVMFLVLGNTVLLQMGAEKFKIANIKSLHELGSPQCKCVI